jgi:ribosomal protein L32
VDAATFPSDQVVRGINPVMTYGNKAAMTRVETGTPYAYAPPMGNAQSTTTGAPNSELVTMIIRNMADINDAVTRYLLAIKTGAALQPKFYPVPGVKFAWDQKGMVGLALVKAGVDPLSFINWARQKQKVESGGDMNLENYIRVKTLEGTRGLFAREFSDEKRKRMAKSGTAMRDGSFPISTPEDLSNAKRAIGRAKDPAKARAWVNKRAKQMGKPKIGEVTSGGPGSGPRPGFSNTLGDKLTQQGFKRTGMRKNADESWDELYSHPAGGSAEIHHDPGGKGDPMSAGDDMNLSGIVRLRTFKGVKKGLAAGGPASGKTGSGRHPGFNSPDELHQTIQQHGFQQTSDGPNVTAFEHPSGDKLFHVHHPMRPKDAVVLQKADDTPRSKVPTTGLAGFLKKNYAQTGDQRQDQTQQDPSQNQAGQPQSGGVMKRAAQQPVAASSRKCPKCGMVIKTGKICANCGSKMGAATLPGRIPSGGNLPLPPSN